MSDAAISSLVFFSAIVAALFYSFIVSSKLPKGISKLISLLPIFYIFTTLPLLLSSAFTSAVATFFFSWLANFKLLLFAFDQGPLYPPKSLVHFITFASLPVKIDSDFDNKKKPPFNLWIESLFLPILMNYVYNHKQKLNPHVMLILYCVVLFIMIDILVFISNAMIRVVVGVELQRPSDEPYLATSLQDFWGRRWNLMVTNSLRDTIYLPVKSAFPGKKWATFAAVMATFVVSGLMHEQMFYYMTRVSPTWEMTSFFILHGVCVVVELRAKKALMGICELPPVVARLLTMGFMAVTSFWLFFPPVIKSGADVKVLNEYKVVADHLKTMFKS